jgi:hypothetical protein
MIIEVGTAARLSLDADNESARYDSGRMLAASEPPALRISAPAVRLTVELRRNLGGMVMRALVGGEFTPGSDLTGFEVAVAVAAFDSGVDTTCPSRLGKPLVPGLPQDFAPSVLAGITAGSADDPLPAGTLRVDRAAHDLMGSSEAAFYQAGLLLRAAFSATITGTDVAGHLARRFGNIPAEQAGP